MQVGKQSGVTTFDKRLTDWTSLHKERGLGMNPVLYEYLSIVQITNTKIIMKCREIHTILPPTS